MSLTLLKNVKTSQKNVHGANTLAYFALPSLTNEHVL